MNEAIDDFLAELVSYVWGLPTVIFLVAGGFYFTIRLRGIQFWAFKHAIDVVRGRFDNPDDPGEINHFRALCTALSGTVGLGNIAGVAIAIKIGGPGATFWMILVGLIGMATKFVECTLAVMFRRVDESGKVHGGPMYYIHRAFPGKLRPLGKVLSGFFAFCTVLGAFGAGGMFQANQVAASVNESFGVPPVFTALALSAFTALVILGGIKRIGKVAGTLVPVMAVSYVLSCIAILLWNFEEIPLVFSQIIDGALNGTAAVGGFAGASVVAVLKQGVRRAAFSNEAGFGSAAIAHSAARTKEPAREGVVALLEPFIDTVVVCTMTALVINISGAWTSDDSGVRLTQLALDRSFPGLGTYFIPLAVTLFAFSTMISWSYYGASAIDFLFGEKWIIYYRFFYCGLIVVGGVFHLDAVINFADSAIALMIFPNMIALFLLSGVVAREARDYFARMRAKEASW